MRIFPKRHLWTKPGTLCHRCTRHKKTTLKRIFQRKLQQFEFQVQKKSKIVYSLSKLVKNIVLEKFTHISTRIKRTDERDKSTDLHNGFFFFYFLLLLFIWSHRKSEPLKDLFVFHLFGCMELVLSSARCWWIHWKQFFCHNWNFVLVRFTLFEDNNEHFFSFIDDANR